ncbi:MULTISPECIES: hypothetical protein [unclassified Lysinibacillus]|uniref:hypothetical protein n=1 Tax=unclassified Lysinibacillus TaxID=2636778 RepID=UPI00116816F6|nr:hypothetical protein [Lysinibacillus sp. CD3-6]QPQ34483.1 hypothetical protein JNUCC52_18065 [Lysinibacillus sp. JNUCC-52]UED79550.1 hypothetical protein FH508_0019445 [Lysinibacillus sp. CD3-6]
MFKRKWIFVGIITMAVAIFSLVAKLMEVESTENKEVQQSFITKEQLSIAKLKEKLREIYVGVDVKTTPKKQLVLQVVADEDYFNLVKKDMEPIAKSVMETSPFKDYTVIFERWEFTSEQDDKKLIDKELSNFLKAIVVGLQEFDVFKNITTDHHTFITVQTSIIGSEKNAQKVALEMEEIIYGILRSQEKNEGTPINEYKVKVMNSQGEVLNE